MKKLNVKTIMSTTPLFLLIFLIGGVCPADNLKTEMRVRPDNEKFTLICRATNVSDEDVDVDRKLLRNSNYFYFNRLYDSNRAWGFMGPSGGLPSDQVNLSPGMKRGWETSDRFFKSLYYFARIDMGPEGIQSDDEIGNYILIKWHLNQIESSQQILLGFMDEDGGIREPVIRKGSQTDEYLIGFLYDENNPLKVVFLLLNGKDAAVSIEKPLTRNSRIIATSPEIEYTRELVIPEMAVERVVVEAGEVGEWRLPWQTVIDLIPEEDLEKIKAAGGYLDLVWKVGDRQSDPLLLSLAEPETHPKQEDALPGEVTKGQDVDDFE